jgi:hypothetical protein
MKQVLKVLNCKGKITLGQSEEIMVSFPEGWIYMTLVETETLPVSFDLITIHAGHQQVIRLKDGQSVKIRSGNEELFWSATIRKVDIPTSGDFVILHCGPPADLL